MANSRTAHSCRRPEAYRSRSAAEVRSEVFLPVLVVRFLAGGRPAGFFLAARLPHSFAVSFCLTQVFYWPGFCQTRPGWFSGRR